MKKYVVTVNGEKFEVVVQETSDVAFATPPAKVSEPVMESPVSEKPAETKNEPQNAAQGKGFEVKAPLPGTILKVVAKNGDAVKEGDLLCVLEAMKMENEIFSPNSGVVSSVLISEGASVNSGESLFVIS